MMSKKTWVINFGRQTRGQDSKRVSKAEATWIGVAANLLA
jgi:hypothetical protein